MRMLSIFGGARRVPNILFALMLVPTLAAAGLTQEAYSHRLWQAADGLPSDVVQAFAETPDHALWIGTTDGLVRFDGSRFRYYQRENTPALGADSVFCLTVTRDGTLWIGVEGGGLVRYRAGHFREFTALDGLSNNVVRAIFEDRDGLLWVGTDQGLFQLHGERLVRIDATNLIPELSVHAITQDRSGAIWAGGTSLLRILAGKAQVYRISYGRQTQRIKSILQTTDGTIWVGAVSGLYRVERRPPCTHGGDSANREGAAPDPRRHTLDWLHRKRFVQHSIRGRACAISRRASQQIHLEPLRRPRGQSLDWQPDRDGTVKPVGDESAAAPRLA